MPFGLIVIIFLCATPGCFAAYEIATGSVQTGGEQLFLIGGSLFFAIGLACASTLILRIFQVLVAISLGWGVLTFVRFILAALGVDLLGGNERIAALSQSDFAINLFIYLIPIMVELWTVAYLRREKTKEYFGI